MTNKSSFARESGREKPGLNPTEKQGVASGTIGLSSSSARKQL
jgi:hypothetical protein